MIEEAATIRRCVFSIPLRDIQRDRRRCSVELVVNRGGLRNVGQQPRGLRHEGDRGLIDFQLLMVELSHDELRVDRGEGGRKMEHLLSARRW